MTEYSKDNAGELVFLALDEAAAQAESMVASGDSRGAAEVLLKAVFSLDAEPKYPLCYRRPEIFRVLRLLDSIATGDPVVRDGLLQQADAEMEKRDWKDVKLVAVRITAYDSDEPMDERPCGFLKRRMFEWLLTRDFGRTSRVLWINQLAKNPDGYDRAAELYSEMESEGGLPCGLRAEYARLLLKMGDHDRALKEFRKAELDSRASFAAETRSESPMFQPRFDALEKAGDVVDRIVEAYFWNLGNTKARDVFHPRVARILDSIGLTTAGRIGWAEDSELLDAGLDETEVEAIRWALHDYGLFGNEALDCSG